MSGPRDPDKVIPFPGSPGEPADPGQPEPPGSGPDWRADFAGVADGDLPDPTVEALLRRTEAGDPRPTLGNLMAILEHDPRWRGRLRLNAFAGTLQICEGDPPVWRELRDVDGIRFARWAEDVYGCAAPTRLVHEAFAGIGADNPHHPVREYLASLPPWDGVPRVHRLLSWYIGAEDSKLNAEISRCFLVSCVARIFSPGCQVHTVLILVGAQGRFKSSALRALGDPWFSDTKIDPGEKDAYQSLPGVWLYELAEMESWSRHAWGRIKAFLSSSEDRYRPSYGRLTERFPRQTVFVGSTNHREFLSDPTGARRFWPVWVPAMIRLEELRRDRGQLWAEAQAMFRERPVWWLESAEMEAAQAEAAAGFAETDPWDDAVAAWAAARTPFPSQTILQECLQIPMREMDKRHEVRVAAILTRLGYRKERVFLQGQRPYLWFAPDIDPKAWVQEKRR